MSYVRLASTNLSSIILLFMHLQHTNTSTVALLLFYTYHIQEWHLDTWVNNFFQDCLFYFRSNHINVQKKKSDVQEIHWRLGREYFMTSTKQCRVIYQTYFYSHQLLNLLDRTEHTVKFKVHYSLTSVTSKLNTDGYTKSEISGKTIRLFVWLRHIKNKSAKYRIAWRIQLKFLVVTNLFLQLMNFSANNEQQTGSYQE